MSDAIHVVETVHGYWNYHLSRGEGATPLCGSRTLMMHTQIPVDTWGHESHLPNSWCRECEARAGLCREVTP